MNNKGQSLVLFVLLIPVLFMLLYMVYEIGKMVKLNEEINNINYLTLEYILDAPIDDSTSDKIEKMILKNKSDISKIDITIDSDKIYITLEDSINNIIFKNIGIFKVKSEFVGYIEDGKKVIERAKW